MVSRELSELGSAGVSWANRGGVPEPRSVSGLDFVFLNQIGVETPDARAAAPCAFKKSWICTAGVGPSAARFCLPGRSQPERVSSRYGELSNRLSIARLALSFFGGPTPQARFL